jgi:transposase-like protein
MRRLDLQTLERVMADGSKGAVVTSFKLRLRDLVMIMADRRISVTHTMILRWVRRYLPEFENLVALRSAVRRIVEEGRDLF